MRLALCSTAMQLRWWGGFLSTFSVWEPISFRSADTRSVVPVVSGL